MKKKLRVIFSLFAALMMFISVPIPVSAKESEEPISVQVSENETWFFPTEEDYNAYLKHQELLNNEIQPLGEFTTTHEISRQNLKKKFVGYHKLTTSWAKASSYTIKSGVSSTASTSATFDGISYTLSVTKSVGVDTTIQADKNRYSRLALYGDFLVKHMRKYYHDQDGIYDKYDYISTQTKATYIDVKYQ